MFVIEHKGSPVAIKAPGELTGVVREGLVLVLTYVQPADPNEPKSQALTTTVMLRDWDRFTETTIS